MHPVRLLNHPVKIACVLVLSGVLNGGCQRPVLGYYDKQTQRNVAYATHDDSPVLMNIVRPVGVSGPRPLVLWIHGGGWAGGSRSGLQPMAETCAAFGYVSATVDYRLTIDGHRFPTQLEDVAAALTYLLEHAEEHGIDRERIVVGGDSAGGHLSLLLGMCREEQLLGVDAARANELHVRGIVNIYGPTDVTALAEIKPANPITRPLLDALMGDPPDKAPQRWKDASPVSFVSKDGPPILTIHGDLDSIVPYSQATTLDERCKAVGQSHRLIRVRGANHGWVMWAHGATMKRVTPAIMHFISECVCE